MQLSLRIPACRVLPAVIENDIVVAEIAQAKTEDCGRGGKKQVLGDVATESVPVVLSLHISKSLEVKVSLSVPSPWEA
jgi:hypothetical protein